MEMSVRAMSGGFCEESSFLLLRASWVGVDTLDAAYVHTTQDTNGLFEVQVRGREMLHMWPVRELACKIGQKSGFCT